MSQDTPVNSGPFREVLKIGEVLADLGRPWYVAGGWAIDLYLHKRRRRHKDVDIAILRDDQLEVQTYLIDRGWTLSKYIGNSVMLQRMQSSERLELPDRGILAEPTSTELPAVDLLLSETNDGEWWFHGDARITHSLETIGLRSKIGVPILCPEIVLLFKSSHMYGEDADSLRRWKTDQSDFQDIRKLLNPEQRTWLEWATGMLHPHHPWLGQLRTED